jgi:lysophospholipase L1-like esterase
LGLVFVGDSVAFGTGDEAGLGGWKGRVSACLAESLTEPAIDDFAVQGAPTADVLAEQCPRLTGRYAVGFAACGANDVIGLRYDGATTLQNLEDIYAALSDVSEVTVVLTIADFVAIRGLGTRARRLSARLHQTNEAIRATASSVGASVIDIAATSEASDPRCWSGDNLHPSAFGYDFIAGQVLSRLRDLSVVASDLTNDQYSSGPVADVSPARVMTARVR